LELSVGVNVQQFRDYLLTNRPPQALSVLFSTGSLFDTASGPYHTLKGTAEGLAARGDAVAVVGTLASGESIRDEWRNVSVRGFRRIGPGSLHWSPAAGTWIRKSNPSVDAVSLQGVWLHVNSVVAAWATARQVPYMISAHGNFNPVALEFARYKKAVATSWFVRDMLAGASCMHASNDEEAATIREYGITAPVAVVPNGVELPSVNQEDRVAATYPIVSQDQRVCLYLGRLHPIKNLESLIDGWSRLDGYAGTWTLVVAGSGDQRYIRSLARHAEAVSGELQIRFVGQIDDAMKSAWLRRSELFVLPSTSEAIPMAPLEAMAHGVPVLITRQCNLPDIGVFGAGMLCDPEAESLHGALDELIGKSSTELLAMGDRARLMVVERFSRDHVVAQLRTTYLWMLGKAPCPEWVKL